MCHPTETCLLAYQHTRIPGRWYVTELPVDHMGVIGYPHSRAWQRNFFEVI